MLEKIRMPMLLHVDYSVVRSANRVAPNYVKNTGAVPSHRVAYCRLAAR